MDYTTYFDTSTRYLELQNAMVAHLEPHGLTPMQWAALSFVGDNSPVASAELKRVMGVTDPRVHEITDYLNNQGYIRRTRSPRDRRAWILHITPSGQRALEKATP